MSTITKEFTVWKGSIPDGCFEAGKKVRARLADVEGFDTLDLEIQAIEEGDGDTDVITFTYESADIDGATLSNCNLSAFYCLCDCCTALVTLGIYGVDDLCGDVPEDGATWRLGTIPRTMDVDSIVLEFTSLIFPLTQVQTIQITRGGDLVFSGEFTYTGPHVIPRTSFEAAFSSGRFGPNGDGNYLPFDVNVSSPALGHIAVPAPMLVHFIGRFIP